MFPTAHSLLLEASLYKVFHADDHEDRWAAIDFLFFAGTYDSYCPQCRRQATFKVTPPTRPDSLKRNKAGEDALKKLGGAPTTVFPPVGMQVIRAQCTRVPYHTQLFVFLVQQEVNQDGPEFTANTTIQKIGQHPSFADLHIANLNRYAAVLTKEQLRELSRGIGLASHDVGIGSYVYLRRTFESLVEEAHQAAKNDSNWDEANYQRSRMSEKVTSLKAHLPGFLVEHPHMYSLLSKGIHELTEEECLSHFETLRVATELILDERLQSKERARKIAAAKTALSKAIGTDRGTP